MGRPVEKFDFSFGEDLRLHHPDEEEEILCTENEELLKEEARRNYEIVTKGFKVIKELQHIEVDKLIEPSKDWLIFNRHTEEERNELKHSILHNGLFTPVIVWEWYDGEYMVLAGLERVDIYKELWEESGEDKKKEYEKIPAFVLLRNEINDVIARIIRIDSNICVRNMNVISKNRAICEKHTALMKLKAFRNQFNVIDELSKSFNVSRTTITNHLLTEKVIDEFLYLFQEGVLTLKAIKKLSKFSYEEQRKIIGEIGINDINEHQISLLKERDIDNEQGLNSCIRVMKEVKEPFFTTIKLKLPKKYLDEAIGLLETLIKRNLHMDIRLKSPKVS